MTLFACIQGDARVLFVLRATSIVCVCFFVFFYCSSSSWSLPHNLHLYLSSHSNRSSSVILFSFHFAAKAGITDCQQRPPAFATQNYWQKKILDKSSIHICIFTCQKRSVWRVTTAKQLCFCTRYFKKKHTNTLSDTDTRSGNISDNCGPSAALKLETSHHTHTSYLALAYCILVSVIASLCTKNIYNLRPYHTIFRWKSHWFCKKKAWLWHLRPIMAISAPFRMFYFQPREKNKCLSAMFSNSKQSAAPVGRDHLIPSTPVTSSTFCPSLAIPDWRRRSQITPAALWPPHLLYVILPQWGTREENMKGSRGRWQEGAERSAGSKGSGIETENGNLIQRKGRSSGKRWGERGEMRDES